MRFSRSVAMAVLAVLAVLAVMAGGCTSVAEERPDLSSVPTTCPQGFAQALGSALNDIQAVGEVSATDIGLGEAADKIACAVRADSSTVGAFAVVVMRAELTDDDVRHLAWELDFNDEDHGYMARASVERGGAVGFLRQTYGSLSHALSDNGWGFSTTFPPRTVVLNVDLKVPHVLKKCDTNGPGPYPAGKKSKRLPSPGPRVVSCRPWTTKEVRAALDRQLAEIVGGSRSAGGRWCEDVTSYDYNWQNDMLCHRPDGSSFYTDYNGANAYLGS